MERYLIFDPHGREVYAGWFRSPEDARREAVERYGEGSLARLDGPEA